MLLACVPLGLGLFGAFALFGFSPGAMGVHLAVIASVFRFGFVRENTRAKPVERAVRISAEGLDVDGEHIPRKLIAEGWYQPRAGGGAIRLFDRHRRILFEARVESEERAQQMLKELGLDASQKRAVFRTVSPVAEQQRYMLGFVLLGMASLLVSRGFGMGPIPLFATVGLAVVLAMLPAKVIVGVDGVLVSWLWRRRFIPMADIVSVRAWGETSIEVETTGGRIQTIYTSSPKRQGGVFTERRDVILARIREAWQSHRSHASGADVATLVARGARSLEEWKKALAALESGDASYRQAALREEDLWRLVEDPRASEDARAAAALLLRKGLDAPGKARVRVAAEATASPKLRVALEAATIDDDGAVMDALDELETDRGSSPLRRAGGGGGR